MLTIDPRNIIPLNEKDKVYVEIYKLTNLVTNKSYVGQAVTHILNQKKYRKYGSKKRFDCHVSEAYSEKKKQCRYLNNSIRKHGKHNFKITLLLICTRNEANKYEVRMIKEHNTLFPNGYNLTIGGKQKIQLETIKKKVATGVKKYYQDKKIKKFQNIAIDDEVQYLIQNRIFPLNRDNKQYGWYFLYKKIKVDFGGVHTSIADSRQEIENFIRIIKNNYNATQLDA